MCSEGTGGPRLAGLAGTLFLLSAAAAGAQEHRELSAHMHGWGAVDIAMEAGSVAIALRAPGADLVGFEHQPVSAEETAAVEAAKAQLSRPLELIAPPAEAQCSVTLASADIGTGDEHTEFEAQYELTCVDSAALTRLNFPYFDLFPNAEGLTVQIVGEAGTRRNEVRRATPQLDLSDGR